VGQLLGPNFLVFLAVPPHQLAQLGRLQQMMSLAQSAYFQSHALMQVALSQPRLMQKKNIMQSNKKASRNYKVKSKHNEWLAGGNIKHGFNFESKNIFFKHHNKIFDLEPLLKSLLKSYTSTEVHCVHSIPECIDKLFVDTPFKNRK
jgi:hypothetical protein